MEGHGDSPPIWPQPPISAARRRNSSPLLTPPLLIILFPIITLVLLFFAAPLFVSLSSQIFAQARVKKSWDTLNVLLVLFAVICGICARRNDVDEGNGATKSDSTADEVRERWFESRDRKIYDSPARTPMVGAGRLRRSSSSYPDLRQEYSSEIGDDRIRFFDDFELDKFRSPQFHPAQLRRWRNSTPESDIKVIPVDTFVLRSSTPPATPPPQSPAPPPRAQTPPPPPPPPPPTTFPKQSRIYHSVGAPLPPPPPPSPPPTVQKQSPIHEAAEAPPPAPPPQPPPICGHKRERRLGKLERTKSSATKELKMVLSSVQTVLYNQKRKKKRKNRTIYENADQSSPETPRNTAPPQPPPPPPLPSVFHNLFRKASKNKKIHSVPPPPAPPPPPPRAVSSSTTLRPSKKKSQISSSPPPPPPPPERSGRRDIRSHGKPPLPAKTNRLGEVSNSYFNSGSQSPQIPIPLPPPFRMPELRFVTRGDFVKLQNNHSSRCNAPELDDIDVSSSEASDHPPLETVDEGTEGGNGGSSGPRIFCPSPDINIKADTFIARLRDGWKLEKIHSMREKQNVGPC